MRKTKQISVQKILDPGLGFEPRLAGSEPAVLPLDDPGMKFTDSSKNSFKLQFG